MLSFLAVTLLVLVGIALAIFGIIAVVVGLTWLLWPVIVACVVILAVGYWLGKKEKKEKKGGLKE